MKDISKIINLDKFEVKETKEEPKKTVSEIAVQQGFKIPENQNEIINQLIKFYNEQN